MRRAQVQPLNIDRAACIAIAGGCREQLSTDVAREGKGSCTRDALKPVYKERGPVTTRKARRRKRRGLDVGVAPTAQSVRHVPSERLRLPRLRAQAVRAYRRERPGEIECATQLPNLRLDPVPEAP